MGFKVKGMPARQRGVSLAILLFIIVIIGLLTATLVTLTSHSTQANAQQVIATRAFFAAESGAQRQVMAVFPIAGGGATCNNQTFNFNVDGLQGCSAATSCSAVTIGGKSYYQIISRGQCNSGQVLQATRVIEVRLKDLD